MQENEEQRLPPQEDLPRATQGPPSSVEEAPPSADPEWELVQEALAGNERAFVQIYQGHAPQLLRRILRMTGDPEQAKDCLQQVFTEALVALKDYQGSGTLQAWLNRIATTTLFDQFRREKRKNHFLREAWPFYRKATAQAPPIPERLFFDQESRRLVHQCLKKVGAQKRMALLLCDLEGRKIEEVAEELDIPPGTVASRLYHARRDLCSLIAKELQREGISAEEWLHV